MIITYTLQNIVLRPEFTILASLLGHHGLGDDFIFNIRYYCLYNLNVKVTAKRNNAFQFQNVKCCTMPHNQHVRSKEHIIHFHKAPIG